MKAFLNIDDTYALRGIAMLMIIIGHAYNGYPIGELAYYFPSWLHFLHIELWGGMGVGIFLFLSVYGLFLSLNQQKSIDFHYLFKKFKRLFEPFLMYWIVEVVVLYFFNRQELTTHIINEITTLSIHPDIENWFFKVIIIIYIVVITLFKCPISNSTRIIFILTLSLLYLIIMKELGFGQWWYNNILCFSAGAIVGYRYSFFEKISPLIVSTTALALMIILRCIHMNTIVFHLLFVFLSIYAIRMVRIYNAKILQFIGYNSFIFYFMECPVEDEIMMFAHSNFIVYSLLSVLGTFFLSYFCIKCSYLLSVVLARQRILRI